MSKARSFLKERERESVTTITCSNELMRRGNGTEWEGGIKDKRRSAKWIKSVYCWLGGLKGERGHKVTTE